jgi:hypothetical protein
MGNDKFVRRMKILYVHVGSWLSGRRRVDALGIREERLIRRVLERTIRGENPLSESRKEKKYRDHACWPHDMVDANP